MKHTAVMLLTLIACWEGGANKNGNVPGNRPGGTWVSQHAIGIHRDGRYFLGRQNQHLVIGDLVVGTQAIEPSLPPPLLVAFWAQDEGFYLLSNTFTEPERLISYDLATRQIRWQRTLERLDLRLDAHPERDLVVLTSLQDMEVLSAQSGETLWAQNFGEDIRDVDLLPDGRLSVVHGGYRDDAGQPWVKISVLNHQGQATCQLQVPNCAADLVVAQGHRGFLAPTFCGRDPVSVIDLNTCSFLGNLPGFGPVAQSPDGAQVVAFMDRDNNPPGSPPLPTEIVVSPLRYHLGFIDVENLNISTLPLGDTLPRYAFTPDGDTLLIDHDLPKTQPKGPVVLLDLAERRFRQVEGPVPRLDNYVLSADGEHLYAADERLYRIDVSPAQSQILPTAYLPLSVNITPDGQTLLLKGGDERIYRWSVTEGRDLGPLRGTF